MSNVRDEQADDEASMALTPIDPAAAAFERLREEVALVRRAVAGLAAERVSIDIPDYSETLAQILQANAMTAKRLKELNEAPALQMTAGNWGREIATAAENARRADQHALAQARAAFHNATENMKASVRSARAADRQNTWLIATGTVGIGVGAMLWAVIAGLLAPAEPARHGSPEQQAAAILHLSEEKAGEHLIRMASPQLWQDLVLGDRIVIANRDTLDRCLHLANEHRRKDERCIIELPPDPASQKTK